MALVDTYQLVKPSIVAFCSKHSHDPKYAEKGVFPNIIGTGFIIDPRGIILTNQHVVDAFENAPRPKGTNSIDAVSAVLFDQDGLQMKTPGLEIFGVTKTVSHTPIHGHFDRRPADIALVGVKVRDLPACKIRTERGGITEGQEIGTAGFPMGKNGLVDPADGLIQQLSPVLQRGIVSAIQPFAVSKPVSFTINVLLQNGASGSPVFDVETGEVLGVASQRRFEPSLCKIIDKDNKEVILTDGKKIRAAVGLPTNFSLVVPTYILVNQLASLADDLVKHIGDNQISFKDYYIGREAIDLTSGQAISKIQSTTENQVVIKKFDEDASS